MKKFELYKLSDSEIDAELTYSSRSISMVRSLLFAPKYGRFFNPINRDSDISVIVKVDTANRPSCAKVGQEIFNTDINSIEALKEGANKIVRLQINNLTSVTDERSFDFEVGDATLNITIDDTDTIDSLIKKIIIIAPSECYVIRESFNSVIFFGKENGIDFSVTYPNGTGVNNVVSTIQLAEANKWGTNPTKTILAEDLDSSDYVIKSEDAGKYLIFEVAVNNVVFNNTSGVVQGAEYQGRFAASEATIVGNDGISLEYPDTLTAVYAQKGVFGVKAESSTVLALAGHQKPV